MMYEDANQTHALTAAPRMTDLATVSTAVPAPPVILFRPREGKQWAGVANIAVDSVHVADAR